MISLSLSLCVMLAAFSVMRVQLFTSNLITGMYIVDLIIHWIISSRSIIAILSTVFYQRNDRHLVRSYSQNVNPMHTCFSIRSIDEISWFIAENITVLVLKMHCVQSTLASGMNSNISQTVTQCLNGDSMVLLIVAVAVWKRSCGCCGIML